MIEKILKTLSDNFDRDVPIGIVILAFFIAAIV
jgi:hypothetical protein